MVAIPAKTVLNQPPPSPPPTHTNGRRIFHVAAKGPFLIFLFFCPQTLLYTVHAHLYRMGASPVIT